MKTQENLPLFRGELALLLAVFVNSFGVVLMLYSVTRSSFFTLPSEAHLP